MLGVVLLKANVGQSPDPQFHQDGHSPNPGLCGSTAFESIVPRSKYSLPTITEVSESSEADVGSSGDIGECITMGSFRQQAVQTQALQFNRRWLKDY